MKLVFVPFIGAFGGVERLILSLSRFLYEEQVAHKIVCFRDTINLNSYATWPVSIEQWQPARNNLSEARALRRHCSSLSPSDLLVFDLKGAFYAGLAHLKGFHLHLTDPPSLLVVESSRHSQAYRRWAHDSSATTLIRRLIGEAVHRLNRRGVRRAKSVFVMTERIAAELKALYSTSAGVIRPGVAKVSLDIDSPSASNDVMRVLSVSRLEASKRIDQAILALSELCIQSDSSRTSWELEIVGAGPAREELERYASDNGVREHVQFLGRLTDDELEAAYRRASVFVMPAVQGYGLPALEALIRNVPVVLHQDSGVSEILSNTPWTEIIRSQEQLAPALNQIARRIRNSQLHAGNKPAVPTDDQWAAEISQACGWLG